MWSEFDTVPAFDRDPVEQYLAPDIAPNAEQDPSECGFARATRAKHDQYRTSSKHEIDPIEDGLRTSRSGGDHTPQADTPARWHAL